MITEKSIPATLKEFTTTDGTVFLSEGPSENQINNAKYRAESHEEQYDFMYFKIDEELLKEYKSENWHHFKWYFARYRAFTKNTWENGIVRRPADYSINFYNNVTEEDFLFLIRKCLILPLDKQGISFSENLFENEQFINIIFFSGIIDFSDLKNYSDVFFSKILKTKNVELLERLVNKGIITITTRNITRAGDKFSYNRYQRFDSVKYKLKGTLTKAKKDNTRNSEYEEFAFLSTDIDEMFFRKCLSLCKIEKEQIFHDIIFCHNWDLFISSNYGMLSLFYQYYDNMTEEKSFKRAEQVQSALLFNSFVDKNNPHYLHRYSHLKKYAKLDKYLTQKTIEDGKKN